LLAQNPSPRAGRARAAASALALVVLASATFAGTARSDTSTDLRGARAQLDAVTAQIRAAENERDAIKAEISRLLGQIDTNRRAVEHQQARIDSGRATIAGLAGQIDHQQAALDVRAAAVYEAGPATALVLLLDSSSFADFAARLEYVGSVAQSDRDLLTQLTDRKSEAEARGTALAANVAALEATKKRLDQEASTLGPELARQLDVIARLAREQAAAQALVAELNRQAQAPPPNPSPPPSPPPSGGDVRVLIAQYFSPLGASTVKKALCVAQLESGLNPHAQNPISGAAGVFQFIPSVWPPLSRAAGWGGASVFDARANVAVAAWAVGQYGWSMWGADAQRCGL